MAAAALEGGASGRGWMLAGAWRTDFTSSLYLGFRHSSSELAQWSSITTGKPAALWEQELSANVAARVARLAACEAGLIAPSTLHLFWDVMGWLARRPVRIFANAGLYPVARWGVERARCGGAKTWQFRHYDPSDLERKLTVGGTGRPVVVVDGFCTRCGAPAPVAELLQVARRHGGLLLVDDTQALGVLGPGGGGVLQQAGLIREPDVLVISSMAKAFGAPVAVLYGPGRLVGAFEEASETRVHSSPASVAAVAAADAALRRNALEGEARRRYLWALVETLRSGLRGWRTSRGRFPVQAVWDKRAAAIHTHLRRAGIETVPQRDRISVIVTAEHSRRDIVRLVEAMSEFSEEQ